MTHLPSETWDVKPLKGEMYPDYLVGPICSMPLCSHFADHAHHIWRRSFMAGAYSWVEVEGQVVGNLTGLCHQHHELVTTNRSRITFGEGVFSWYDGAIFKGQLQPQPPTRSPVTSHAGLVAEEQVAEQHVHEGHVLSCPACKRPLPRKKIDGPKEEKRPRKTWTVSVPADKAEDGADVLDELVEVSRLELAEAGLVYGEGSGVRYFVLSTALALFVTNAKEILS